MMYSRAILTASPGRGTSPLWNVFSDGYSKSVYRFRYVAMGAHTGNRMVLANPGYL